MKGNEYQLNKRENARLGGSPFFIAGLLGGNK